ncbi:DNA mismatch repair endonuclease MutL [Marinilabiliaceae bacterium JC017]|nr:DNA mismatch repair endonuclease MutL [Marinilabiliaceae bacterium JC017]
MSNIIQLLPDSVANQIAAGEVIQRPASVVKELVENAIDSGADDVKVVIKEAGRSLIQVIDNGCGMSDTDARMAFERHATSKIKEAADLFALRTMGFRGEALASIAAVAQVELKTRLTGEELGTHICISGSAVESQSPVQCSEGTQFIVKNLFYNVPARRRFLKKNSTELRHIINEFQRIALANPGISFSLHHNDMPLFMLPKNNRRQRVVSLLGKQMNSHLIPVEADTTLVKISGFIGKPEAARKTAGDQFFFINNRYMRHPYLHRSVMDSYDNILPPDTIPAYFLFLETDPKIIDVNIHPTKTEIKFEDERAIWQLLNAAIRESLGKYNMVPSIDFDTTDLVDIPAFSKNSEIIEPTIEVNPNFNPFEEEKKMSSCGSFSGPQGSGTTESVDGWEKLYSGFESQGGNNSFAPLGSDLPSEPQQFNPFESQTQREQEPVQQTILSSSYNGESHARGARFFQLKNKYILTSVKSGLMLINQKRAHERILFEQFLRSIEMQKSLAQQSLFPEELHLGPEDSVIVREIMDDLRAFGLDLEERSSGTFLAKGLPAQLDNITAGQILDGILCDFKTGEIAPKEEMKERIAQIMAQKAAMSRGCTLNDVEMSELFDQLFACAVPNFSPSGKSIISILDNDELDKRFQ